MRERMCSTCAFDRKPSKRQTPAEGASSTPFVAPTGASGVLLLVEPEASIGSSETQSSASGNGSAAAARETDGVDGGVGERSVASLGLVKGGGLGVGRGADGL